MLKTGFVYHPDYLKHNTRGHPECSDRLRRIMMGLEETDLINKLEEIQPTKATLEQIGYVHDASYISEVDLIAGKEGWLDPDTPVSRGSYNAALLAAGGLINAADLVLRGDVKNAFALPRPPGHHAESNEGMGFCLFNNVAIAARYLKKERNIGKILIFDWDVHHGNGTQDSFYDDPSVLYISTHQSPLYPGTGFTTDTGLGDGQGYTVDIPLPGSTGDVSYSYVMDEVVIPISLEFDPDFILISAGFDAHFADPLAGMSLSTAAYADFTDKMKMVADETCGNLVLTLEGGYDFRALTCSVISVFNSLGDFGITTAEPYQVPKDKLSEGVKGRVEAVKEIQKNYWSL
ncbi:MAG: histone deacetylase [Halobacteriota archaeon]|nr:histone deacetylase [Halobacteriota archaeon]